MKGFRERLGSEVLVFDGGVGTYLYDKGVFINTCFDELNLTGPDLVRSVHRDYIDAGADIIETNTFGANAIKLASFGLEPKVREINVRGAELAREVASGKVLVAGSVGPLGVQIEPLGVMSLEEAKAVFTEQIRGLLDGGADLLVLETFSFIHELEQAVAAARALDKSVPIVAQTRLDDDGRLIGGGTLARFAADIGRQEVDAIGFNCSVGPRSMLEALEELRKLTSLPLSAQPNAGLPQRISHRSLYMASPEYMAEYAKRFIQAGAAIVGGCCGTHPAHIRAIRRAVAALSPARRLDTDAAELVVSAPSKVRPVPRAEKSKLSASMAAKRFVSLVELVSPKGISPGKQIEKASALKNAGVDAINIPDGPRAAARMSALALASILERDAGVEVVLHLACRDRNVIGMQSDLLGAWALGVRNILAITGDPPKLGTYPDAKAVFDVDSIGLTNLINRLNHGLDLAGNEIGEPTGFFVGVGVNPGAINPDEELRRLDWKIKAGAEYMITQPVFDVSVFERFHKRVETFGIPIICGIWPLISYRNAEFMNNEVPGASVPADILDRMRKASGPEEAFEEGIRIAEETLSSVRGGVAGVQLSAPLGRVEGVIRILREVRKAS